jgi:uncharacterized protein
MKKEEKKISLALVTGASSGIGEALCHFLADKGIDLLITGRNNERLTALALDLQKKVKVVSFTADLAIAAQRAMVVEKIHIHAPDLVINNAGFGLYGEALTHTTGAQLEILEVNGNAVLELTLEAARTLITKNKAGVIMNVSSAAAFYVFPDLAVYSAAKTFVLQFSQSLDMELQSCSGIRVLTCCPGMVETAFTTRAAGKPIEVISGFAMTPEFVAQEIWDQIQEGTPYRIIDWKTRWGTHLSRIIPKRWLAKILKARLAERISYRPIIKI